MVNNPSSTDEENPLVSQVRDILMESGNCAQTSFVVLQEEFELEGDQILKALTPFPGIALRGETCGTVIGGLMALGLEFGRDDLSDGGDISDLFHLPVVSACALRRRMEALIVLAF